MDRGTRVIYKKTLQGGKVVGSNNRFVFVLYDGDMTPKATSRRDLEPELPKKKKE